ncbi:MAG: BCD family MFS transporter [Pseudomonadota bacterium]
MDAVDGTSTPSGRFGWFGVVRLGAVQMALGAIVILTTSTLNRVMVVELALPAFLPGLLVGWHYAVQLSRPRWGYGADMGGARTPWIVGGMAALGLGAVCAAGATALTASSVAAGIAAGFAAFFVIGVGVGAAGTNLLALLAILTPPARKAAAAAITWIMMILGFVITAGVAGALLDPFSMGRLVGVTAGVSTVAVALAALALWGLEAKSRGPRDEIGAREKPTTTAAAAQHRSSAFRTVIAEIWGETQARRFTVFIFVSMLAYSAQDLILEPFAGLVYGYTPGESTSLAGVQNGGVLLGMIATAIIGTVIGKSRGSFMRRWTVGGCIASAFALAGLAAAASVGPSWPLKPSVFALGLANGAFAVAAIGSMMTLASAGAPAREGTRMGLWGASQAIAFGLGGFLGAAAIDIARATLGEVQIAFCVVFAAQAVAFVVAAWLAARVGATRADGMTLPAMPAEALPAE